MWNPKNPSVANVEKLKRKIDKLRKGTIVRLGGMTDCFQPIELDNRITYMQEFEFDIKQLEEELENEVNTSSESSFNYKEQYGVIVICKNEEDQEKVYNKLLDQGYECKVVTT